MSDFFQNITAQLKTQLPEGAAIPPMDQLAFVFSPEVVPVPKAALATVQKAVENFYAISHKPEYQQLLNIPPKPTSATDSSVLMAYDFHIDAEGKLSLIEINTNASGYFLATLLYQALSIQPIQPDPLKVLFQSFEAEWKAFNATMEKPKRIAIADDQIEKQNMFLEFLLYKNWFEKNGWPAELSEIYRMQVATPLLMDEHKNQIDFVYNRWTDFLFAESKSASLKSAYEMGLACISPHPHEYLLLADKQRLIDLSKLEIRHALKLTTEQVDAIDSVLIPTFEVNKTDPEWLWANRKKLFFKPKRSYGGKATYRGMSISKKTFEEVLKGDFLAQEYRPAPTFKESWKYDLRFYVYRDQVQLAVARLYQGQVTNFSHSGGGFAAIQFI